ncbi:MAG: hypothetical protein J7L15_03895 [Clostridiales bacterium]|nr:hypothetical protein [Clostridiales bacterium]
MVLNTGLKHVETEKEIEELINAEENVIICCGRMGPMCLPVYASMEELEASDEYENVVFRDLAFDSPEAIGIRRLPEVRTFRGLPFTIYYKNGKVVNATSSLQSKANLVATIKETF